MLYGAQKGIFEMEKKEKDLISIIVPVYNAEKYITRCVQSILEQEYSNFELILIDDGSTDKSPKILSQLDKLDDRIMLLNQKMQMTILRHLPLQKCSALRRKLRQLLWPVNTIHVKMLTE